VHTKSRARIAALLGEREEAMTLLREWFDMVPSWDGYMLVHRERGAGSGGARLRAMNTNQQSAPVTQIRMKIRRLNSQFTMYQSIQRTINAVINPTSTSPRQPRTPSVKGLTICVSQRFPRSSENR